MNRAPGRKGPATPALFTSTVIGELTPGLRHERRLLLGIAHIQTDEASSSAELAGQRTTPMAGRLDQPRFRPIEAPTKIDQ
jgi:hypothetical protein